MPADHKEEAMNRLSTLIEAHPRATDIHITEGGPVFSGNRERCIAWNPFRSCCPNWKRD